MSNFNKAIGQHKYSGRYCLGHTPSHTAHQNIESWSVISAMLNAYGGADVEDIAAAVSQHKHPDGGRAFVEYCIRNGWLKQT